MSNDNGKKQKIPRPRNLMCEKVASSDPFLLSGWVRKDASEIQPLGLGAFMEEAVPVGTHGDGRNDERSACRHPW